MRIERFSWIAVTLSALLAIFGILGVAPANWTVQSTPSPAYNASFSAVACPTSSECVAVGSASGTKGSTPAALAEVWNGTAWRYERVPSPHGLTTSGQIELTGVACPATTLCVAVGTYTVSGSELAASHSFSEIWRDGKWTERGTALVRIPGLDGTQLSAVACPSATACVAVGNYGQGKGSGFLSEQWNGSSWSLIKTPTAPYQSIAFTGVSCPEVGTCTAVGSDQEQGPALAAELTDGAWTYQPTEGTTAALNAVSCPAVNDCVAVGQNYNSTDSALVEVWHGKNWRLVHTSDQAGVELNGVSCVNTTDCTAVGTRYLSQTWTRGLAELWIGGHWISQRAVDPSTSTVFNGVACPTTTCAAAGSYTASSRSRTLLEQN